MLGFAEFLLSSFFIIKKSLIISGQKHDKIRLCIWCQERDLNSRPPAYESEVTYNGEIISEKTYKKLKQGKYPKNRGLKHLKQKEAHILDFTTISLQQGQKSENNCRVFADLIWSAKARLFSLTKLLKSIYMSIYLENKLFLHTTFTSCFNVKKPNRYSYKLTSCQQKKGETR